jgi:multicomponent K+:H+ antiporter subunit D
VAETLPIAALLLASLLMVSQAETVLGYTRATADALHEPQRYIDAVRGAMTVPHPVVRGGTP